MFAPGSGRYLAFGLALVGAGALAAALAPALRLPLAGGTGVGLGVWTFLAVFFRDPQRTVGPGIVSAADGRVLSVASEGAATRVAVFMNVTNVHVNRAPLDGTVARIERRGEGFRPAYAPGAAHNRRCHYEFTTSIGPVEVVQMTGLVARRLVPLVRVGESVHRGERFGMIVLGSRVDVLLPRDRVEILVRPGERVTAGVTPIARERAP